MKTLRNSVLAGSVILLSMIGSPTKALAAAGDIGRANGNIRSCTRAANGNTTCQSIGYASGRVKVFCYKDDGWVNGTNRWFDIAVVDGPFSSPPGTRGWMNASVVYQQPIVPRCP
jgi:hypothetical protein